MNYLIRVKPEKLAAVLWKYQDHYSPEITTVRQRLMNATVPLEDGGMKPLKETVFPLAPIRQTFETMDISTFPFLAILDEMNDVQASELTLLSLLGVETSQSLSLFMKALEYIISTNSQNNTVPRKLINTFEKLNEYSGGNAARERIRYDRIVAIPCYC